MKRDVETLLSVSKAAIKTHIMNELLALPFDIRDDESTSTTFHVWMALSPLWKKYLLTIIDG
jgi:hypothetical protein